MEVVIFFLGSISMYAFVMWIHVRKLKKRVKNWSSNKGAHFVLGIGRDQPFFPLSPARRAELKVRLAAPGEIVSDEDLDLFLRLYRCSFLWIVVGELGVFAAVIAVTALRHPVT
jgi:hypothetical protein